MQFYRNFQDCDADRMLWSRLSSVTNNGWVLDKATDLEDLEVTTMLPTTVEPFEKTIGFKTVDDDDLTDGDLIVPLFPQDYVLNTLTTTKQTPVSINYYSSQTKRPKKPKKTPKPWKNKPQNIKKPNIPYIGASSITAQNNINNNQVGSQYFENFENYGNGQNTTQVESEVEPEVGPEVSVLETYRPTVQESFPSQPIEESPIKYIPNHGKAPLFKFKT